jgi:heterodisulfide reductase subunit A-like polyferredoxin
LVTNVSNVPYQNPVYSQINSIGRQWVYQYTLATVKETLAYVRGKYTTVPIPGSEVTLNQADLLTDARAEKSSLLEVLRGTLDESSRNKQMEKRAAEEDYLQKTLNNVPLPLYIF